MLLTDNSFATYESTADGRTATFQLVDSDVTVNPSVNMGKFSFYPAASEQWTGKPDFLIEGGKPVIFLASDIHGQHIGNLLSTVPMISNNFVRGYSIHEPYLWFHVATAVLKVDIEGVPANEAVWACVSHPSYPICGVFNIADDAHIYASDKVDLGFPTWTDANPGYNHTFYFRNSGVGSNTGSRNALGDPIRLIRDFDADTK